MKKLTSRLVVVLLAGTSLSALGLGIAARADNFHPQITAEGPVGEGEPGDPPPPCPEPGDPGDGDPAAQAQGSDPVSPFTGAWFYRHTDLEVPGVFPIRIVRRYDSRTTYESALGYGWAFTFDMRLFQYPDNSVVIRYACGRRETFQPNGGGYTGDLSPGWRQTLAQGSGGDESFILTGPRGTKRFFDDRGRLRKIQNPQGNYLRLSYVDDAKHAITGTSPFSVVPGEPLTVAYLYRLDRIEEVLAADGVPDGVASGRFVSFQYDDTGQPGVPADGLLESIQTHDGRTVTYDHKRVPVEGDQLTTGDLTTVTLPTGIVQTFEYADTDFPHGVSGFQDGAGMEFVRNDYDAQGHVLSQIFEKAGIPGRLIQLNYSPNASNLPPAFQGDFDHTIDGILFNCSAADTRCTLVTRHIRDDTGTETQTAITLYKYYNDGYLREIVDPLGNLRVFIYEAPRRFLDKIQIFYNPDGLAGTANRKLQKDIDLLFDDPNGDLIERKVTLDPTDVNSEVVTESWTYDHGWIDTHTVVSSANPTEKFRTQFTFFRDASGRPENIHEIKRLHFDDPVHPPEITTLDYDPDHKQLTGVTLPDSQRIGAAYFTEVQNSGGVIRNGLVKEIAFDGFSQLKTTYDYDAQGRTSAVTDARSFTTILTWDDFGRLTQMENPLQQRTIYRYGGSDPSQPGRFLVEVERGQMGSTQGAVTRFVYDTLQNLDRIDREVQPNSFIPFFDFTYDSDGRPLTITDGDGVTVTRKYDTLRRLTESVDEASNKTKFGYDAENNRIQVTDPEDFVRNFRYDALDRLTRVEEVAIDGTNDALTNFAYDAAGNVRSVVTPESYETTYTYNALSRLRFVDRPLDPPVEYQYDLRGRLDATINSRGQTIDYDYENWGPVKQIDHLSPTQTVERTILYTYDDAGNVLTVADSAIDASLADIYVAVSPDPGAQDPPPPYDALNRLRRMEIRFPAPVGTKTLTHTYDRFGNRNGLTFTDGAESFVHSYVYHDPATDLLDRLKTATLPNNATDYAFTYLGNDDLDVVSRPSGVSTDFNYETHGPLQSIDVMASGGRLDLLEYVERDKDDRINKLQETFDDMTEHLYTYGYDAGGRLTSATYPPGLGLPSVPDSFGYDLDGNRETPGSPNEYDYNDNDQLTKSPDDPNLCYDPDGNLATKRTAPDCETGSVTETFTYSHVNRLTGWTDSTTTLSFLYDPFGRRVKKATAGGGATWFVWDGDQLLAEYDAATGARGARYAYTTGFAPAQFAISTGPGSEALYDIHTDHLGTPRLLTDASGTPVWRAAYEAFGKVHLDPANSVANFNLRFPGQYHDAETALHYNWHRYYDPSLGRYVSADPIGQDGGINLYAYAMNGPQNRIDPMGLDWMSDLSDWYETSPTGRQLTSIGDAMGGMLALALGDTATAHEAFLAASANSGHALLDEMCASTGYYAAYYGALGTSAAAATTAAGLIALEATTAIRVEIHGTHGGRVPPHLQGIRGPGWGKTIWRFPPH